MLPGTASSVYDDLGNVKESTRTYTGVPAKTFTYTYHPDGSRKTMANSAGTWTYTYDSNGRLRLLNSPADVSSNGLVLTYFDNGWLKKRTLPNGSYTDHTYNGLGLPTLVKNRKSDGTVRSEFGTFAYDGVFNTTSVETVDHVQTLFEGTNTWTWDTKDRLTQEVYDQAAGNSIDYTSTFGYDAAFNPTTFKGASRSYDADNRRSATGYSFDGNGAPTTYAGTGTGYDVEGRLKSVGTQTNFLSRSDGLRAWKAYNVNMPASDPPSVAVEGATYYYYDRGNPVLECSSDGTVTAVNVFADDGLVSRKQAGARRHYQVDPQGSVAHRLEDDQDVISNSKNDAYGQGLSIPGPSQGSDPYGWNGRWGYQLDSETGLHYCQQRYYDAAAGRWLTRDPIGYAGGMNLYGYCQAAPVGNADPSGLAKVIAYYYPVQEVGFGESGDHMGIEVIDNAKGGGSWFFAGGPERYGFGRPDSGAWGDLIDHRGRPGDRGQEDRMQGRRTGGIVLVDDLSAVGPWLKCFSDISDGMAGKEVYDLPGPNSNSWAAKLILDAGLWDEDQHATDKGWGDPWLPGFRWLPWGIPPP
jgi:RHS repeat-associated protein